MRLSKGRPRVWRVLDQKFPVVYNTEIQMKNDAGETSGMLGVTDLDNQDIHISLDQSDDKMRETELHEMLHIVVGFTGLHQEMGHEMTERLVKVTAPLLLHALRANPLFVNRLMSK